MPTSNKVTLTGKVIDIEKVIMAPFEEKDHVCRFNLFTEDQVHIPVVCTARLAAFVSSLAMKGYDTGREGWCTLYIEGRLRQTGRGMAVIADGMCFVDKFNNPIGNLEKNE